MYIIADEEIKSINELIEKLRKGKVAGTIQIKVDNNGRLNNIFVRSLSATKEIEDQIQKVKLKGIKINKLDFSRTNVSGSNFSGLNLTNTNFSYSQIIDTNISNSNLSNSNFYKAQISQTDMSNSYGVKSLAGSYITGSVNLYNTNPSGENKNTNPYDDISQNTNQMLDDTMDISRLLLHKKNY